jgi:hypothetical protein
MKKSRTARAVDALMRSIKGDVSRPLTVYRAARRYGLDPSGVLRAFKRRLRQRRCKECGQVIR